MVPTAANIAAADAILATTIVGIRLLFELPFPSTEIDAPPMVRRRLKGLRDIARAWAVYFVGLTGSHFLICLLEPWTKRYYGAIAAFPVWLLLIAFITALLIWLTVQERNNKGTS